MKKHSILAATFAVIHLLEYVSSSKLLSAERVFDLDPRHVWRGYVRAKQLKDGQLPLCGDSTAWNIAVADQVCHDLGFYEGAMLFGSTPTSLQVDESATCIFMDDEGVFCRENTDPCSSTAWVSCQFPGFVGCYAFTDQWEVMVSYQLLTSAGNDENMTIEICLSRCRVHALRYRIAGVRNGRHCYCGKDIPYFNHVDKSLCVAPCAGDSQQACGGAGHISIYETNLGQCGGTYDLRPTNDTSLYLASPGFPGRYFPPIQCKWLFNMPNYTSATVKIIGMDFTDQESLSLAVLNVYEEQMQSTEVWQQNMEPFVKRGNWTVDVTGNTSKSAVALIFDASTNSTGDRQFLITVSVNEAPRIIDTTPEPTTPSSRSPTQNKHKKGRNGWAFAIIIAAVLMVSIAVVVGYFYRQNRMQLHGDRIFRQSQLANEAGVYGDTVHLQPDIDKEPNIIYPSLQDDSVGDTPILNTISPSGRPQGEIMNNI